MHIVVQSNITDINGSRTEQERHRGEEPLMLQTSNSVFINEVQLSQNPDENVLPQRVRDELEVS